MAELHIPSDDGAAYAYAYADYYNPASKHPSVYVIEENRFC